MAEFVYVLICHYDHAGDEVVDVYRGAQDAYEKANYLNNLYLETAAFKYKVLQQEVK